MKRRDFLKGVLLAAGAIVAPVAIVKASKSKALVPFEPPLVPVEIIPVAKDGEWHAFFSPTAAQQFGFCLYRNEQGELVPLTAVYRSHTEAMEKYRWEDKVYGGVVQSYAMGTRWGYNSCYKDYHRRRHVVSYVCNEEQGKKYGIIRLNKDRLSEWELDEFHFSPGKFINFHPEPKDNVGKSAMLVAQQIQIDPKFQQPIKTDHLPKEWRAWVEFATKYAQEHGRSVHDFEFYMGSLTDHMIDKDDRPIHEMIKFLKV